MSPWGTRSAFVQPAARFVGLWERPRSLRRPVPIVHSAPAIAVGADRDPPLAARLSSGLTSGMCTS